MFVFNTLHVCCMQNKKSKNKADKRKAEELIAAGKHTMNAAIGNLVKRLKADDTSGQDGSPPPKRSMIKTIGVP